MLVDTSDITLFRQLLMLRPRHVQLPVLALYRTLNLNQIVLASEYGITGHAMQALESIDLYAALTGVRRRSFYFCPTINAGLTTEFDYLIDTLGEIPVRILSLVASGATNHTIAVLLHITDKTVEYHLRQISRKLNLQTRTELATWWARLRASEQGGVRDVGGGARGV
ncbi:response regulator transcription factor [Candidatus Gracilibacteria bacterium]|nr:response regulator transcription factor [Candidatus Gracilibacteria bacterium]